MHDDCYEECTLAPDNIASEITPSLELIGFRERDKCPISALSVLDMLPWSI